MKIISWNINGLRAVHKRGFTDWMLKKNYDIVCLQEIKAHVNQLSWDLTHLGDYHAYFNSAEKKGYSGVAVYTKEKPLRVEYSMGMKRFDSEGRILKLDFKDFSLFNLYIPNGGRGKEWLDYKLNFYAYFLDYLKKHQDKNLILVGDFNIAHKEIDLARPKQNQKNIMFTPIERQQLDKLINLGFIDTFRMFNKEGGNYSWWAYYRDLRQRNIGWRIDYAFVSNPLEKEIKQGFILKDVTGSDHCPVGIKI